MTIRFLLVGRSALFGRPSRRISPMREIGVSSLNAPTLSSSTFLPPPLTTSEPYSSRHLKASADSPP